MTRLSRNPKGYFLVVLSDCHLSRAAKSLSRIVEMDKAIQDTAERVQKDTLLLMSADHSFDLRIRGEHLVETPKAATAQQVISAISLEEQHTAEDVPVLAMGPGASRVHGFISNADIFHVMTGAFGWERYGIEARYPVPGNGAWDCITLDSDMRRLYVLDADTGKLIGRIGDTRSEARLHQQRERRQGVDVRRCDASADPQDQCWQESRWHLFRSRHEARIHQ